MRTCKDCINCEICRLKESANKGFFDECYEGESFCSDFDAAANWDIFDQPSEDEMAQNVIEHLETAIYWIKKWVNHDGRV